MGCRRLDGDGERLWVLGLATAGRYDPPGSRPSRGKLREDRWKAGDVRELATVSVAPGDAGKDSGVAGELRQLERRSRGRPWIRMKDGCIKSTPGYPRVAVRSWRATRMRGGSGRAMQRLKHLLVASKRGPE